MYPIDPSECSKIKTFADQRKGSDGGSSESRETRGAVQNSELAKEVLSGLV
jgi:hypothetical protein